jgi:hypothetical protein
MLRRPNWWALLHRQTRPQQLEFDFARPRRWWYMPIKEDDKPVVLHPMTFEDALKQMLKAPQLNPAKRNKSGRSQKPKVAK